MNIDLTTCPPKLRERIEKQITVTQDHWIVEHTMRKYACL